MVHMSSADLSVLSDFGQLKHHIDLNPLFISTSPPFLKKVIKRLIHLTGIRLTIRKTITKRTNNRI
jgi:hypothetical protein